MIDFSSLVVTYGSSWNVTQEEATTIFFITLGVIFFVAIATSIVQNKFKQNNIEFSAKNNSSGKTGAEVARAILAKNNISNVKVMMAQNEGMDHYNPRTNVIMLSPTLFNSKSISASAIAAHEAGHAIQWGKKEFGIKFRDVLAKPVQIASQIGSAIFGMTLFLIIFGGPNTASIFLFAGIMLYGSSTIFSLATLPVEFGASKKAMKELKELGYFKNSEQEEKDTKKLLRSAAMTYVLAALTAILFLMLIIIRILARRQR